MIKTYSEVMRIKNFEDRIKYLQTNSTVGFETFGHNRFLNQNFYKSPRWRKIRRDVILRDSDGNNCLDLNHKNYIIYDQIYIHHINAITEDDIINDHLCIYDMENLIACSFNTHQRIHYSTDIENIPKIATCRRKNDTCPWR